MADQDDLRHMVLNFRVAELQVLLGFAGRNKSGRKDQMQARALDLLKLRSAPIQMKIRELNKRYPAAARPAKADGDASKGGASSGSGHLSGLNSPLGGSKSHAVYGSHQMSTRNSASSAAAAAAAAMNSNNNNQSHGNSSSTALDFSSKYSLQSSNGSGGVVGGSAAQQGSSSRDYPVHPDVKFKKLPFYQVMAELLKPASLVPHGSSRFQENNFVFHFTPQQAHDVAMSRDMRPGAKMEYSVQIQMRFCLLETSCDQEDNFPPSICVKVNGKMCPLPNPIPTNKPGVEPKRPSRPVNISLVCKLSPTVSNQVNVSWASEYGRGYAIGIYLVKRLTSANLLQKLRSQGVRNADHTKALIKEKLAHDADSEIATTSLRVSLMCPLGKMRMTMPCRATTCTHLQCFDASLYLQMNEKKATWICPVCDKPALFDSLVIDGLFMEIFSATTDCNEIQFSEDGSWSPFAVKKESAHVVGLQVSNKVAASSFVAAPPKAPKPDVPKPECIDLTIESSDEDDDDGEPPNKVAATAFTSGASSPSLLVSRILGSSLPHGSGNLSTGTVSIGGSSGSSGSSISSIGHSMGNRNWSLPSPLSNYRDMPFLDSPPPQISCPPVSSPYTDFLQSSHSSLYNFPGYELFSLIGNEGSDRQLPAFSMNSNIPSSSGSISLSNTTHKPLEAPSSPDVISLD